MDALTIQEAAETTGWSSRMLRYIERAVLSRRARRPATGCTDRPSCSVCGALRELLDRYDIGLGDVGFASRMRSDPISQSPSSRGSSPRPTRPEHVPALQGRRPLPGRLRPQGDHARRARDARPDGDPRASTPTAAAQGRAHHRLAAHDDPDRGADRDARRARRRGPLGVVQHLLDAGPRRRRGRRRPERHAGESARASRSSPGRARRSRSTGGAPSRR